MRVVALISGGKDSCYNMVQCVMAGHDIVALANLKPESKDELDSYMYQTVGHQGIELYAEAMNIPLFRQPTLGVALHNEKLYTPTPEDEVEDLYQLLLNVKEQVEFDAVSVGAVLSDYQRLRVENVCSRLGLVSLAYLWRRDQGELLQEMIDSNIEAIIIKVAALGLDPEKHLGLKIAEIQPHLIKMNEKYGLNICGEGGEYETFTLDCPLFCKALVIDDYETVIHSNDGIAPVGYVNFTQLRLVPKEGVDEDSSLWERLNKCRVKTAEDYITDIDQAEVTDTESDCGDGDHKPPDEEQEDPPVFDIGETEPTPYHPSVAQTSSGWVWIGGIVGEHEDLAEATTDALKKLEGLLHEIELNLSNLVCLCMYVKDMSKYSEINSSYLRIIEGPNPPVRICLGTGLNEATPIVLNAIAYAQEKHTMHVQSLSHWAPANIGPYSQAIRVENQGIVPEDAEAHLKKLKIYLKGHPAALSVENQGIVPEDAEAHLKKLKIYLKGHPAALSIGDIIYVAGQIGLVPGSLEVVAGGIKRQCRLALRHVGRLVKAMDKDIQLRDVVQGICYVTNASYISEARKEWERRTNNAILEYVVVPELPRAALVEWQVWAHRGNTRFEYEETGCVVGENRVSIKRRWNYENTVCAVVCYVSLASSMSNPSISEGHVSCGWDSLLTEPQLTEVLCYALDRLFRGLPPPEDTLPPPAPCSLTVYYRSGRAFPSAPFLFLLTRLGQYSIAPTLIPVSQLNHPNTFISIVAVRHE